MLPNFILFLGLVFGQSRSDIQITDHNKSFIKRVKKQANEYPLYHCVSETGLKNLVPDMGFLIN